jgi:hypothetical protein
MGAGWHWAARVFTFFTLGALGLSQISIYDQTPNTRAAVEGSETVLGYLLSPDARMIRRVEPPSSQVFLRLPSLHRKAVPQLLGILRHGADIETFLDWVNPDAEPYEHHIEIFRGRRGTMAAFVHDFTLIGGIDRMSFFEPPDARDTPAVLIDVQGGSYWGTTYLIAPNRQSIDKLFDATDYEFTDLNRDGVYELIAWNRWPFDVRCNIAILSMRLYPEIFVRAGASYRQAWPPTGWLGSDFGLIDRFKNHERDGVPVGANLQITAGFADLYGDGAEELIVLQDQLLDKVTQALAVYRLETRSFHVVAQTPLPPERIAYLLDGVRDSPNGKEILVRTATPAACQAEGIPEPPGAPDTAYIVRGDQLQLEQPGKR